MTEVNDNDDREFNRMTLHSPLSSRQAMAIHITRLVIQAIVAGGSLYFLYVNSQSIKKQVKNVGSMYNRIELHPGSGGKLVANVWKNGQLVKIRYATKKEEWHYSYTLMQERLSEMGYVEAIEDE